MALKTSGKMPSITRTGGIMPTGGGMPAGNMAPHPRSAMGGPAMKALATPGKIRTPRNLAKLNVAMK